ncbi:MAG: hypothetical protein ACI8T1_003486 [Verrucomicrobiales bacterium]
MSEPFIDLPIRFSAQEPIDVATFGDDDVYVYLSPFRRDKHFARLIGIQAEEEVGMKVDAVFRLERPPHGWPDSLGLRVTDKTNPSFSTVAEGDGNRAFLSFEKPPQISITLPPTWQVLSPAAPQYEAEFIYVCESPILLDSIGDGDVYLFDSGQPGRLVTATASEDGREVSAKFVFDRDIEGIREERTTGGRLFGGRMTSAFAFKLGECVIKRALPTLASSQGRQSAISNLNLRQKVSE